MGGHSSQALRGDKPAHRQGMADPGERIAEPPVGMVGLGSARLLVAVHAIGSDSVAMQARLAVLSLFLLAVWPSQDPQTAGPKRQIEVVVDGVPHRMLDGGEIVVKAGDRELKVSARVWPTRRFAAAGIGFEYPTDMGFEFEGDEGDEGVSHWTLDGSNVVMIVQQFQAGETDELAQTVLSSVNEQFGGDGKLSPAKVTLGGKDLAAHRVGFEVAGHALTYYAVPIVGAKGSVVLMLQDSAPFDQPSEEMKGVLELLAKTFTIEAR
ncbi:MAG: hypothetical protein JNL12_20070 [Planctomycetes bacterium]|nr:hypothetical protein [Planctomycetota bacterium]